MTDAVDGCLASVYPYIAEGVVRRTVVGCDEDSPASCGGHFGNHVLIEHRGPSDPLGPLYSFYAHLSDVNVDVGDTPDFETRIGSVGATGETGGLCHLHFGLVNFAIGHLGAYDESDPEAAIDNAEVYGYVTTADGIPQTNCDRLDLGHGCSDPKTLLPKNTIVLPPQSRLALEIPLATNKCVAGLGGGVYVSVASMVDSSNNEWQYVHLPSDAGPSVDPYGNETCSTQATYGWVNSDTERPATGFQVTVDPLPLNGSGYNVRADHTTASSMLTKVWGGQTFWVLGTASEGNGCTDPWLEISVPPTRTGGAVTGWVCGEAFSGGMCASLSVAGMDRTDKETSLAELVDACGSVPVVTTGSAVNLTAHSASLSATVNPKGSPTTLWFDYDTDTTFCCATDPPRPVGQGSVAFTTSITVDGLECDQTYFFRAQASNPAGAAPPGDIRTFRTEPCGGVNPEFVELIEDPSFELGNGGWWAASQAFHIDDSDFPRTGDYYAHLSAGGVGGNNLTGGVLSPRFTIPPDALDVDLRFYYSITSDETTSSAMPDKLDVFFVRNGTVQQPELDLLSNLDETSGPSDYDPESEDIDSSYFGDELQLFFRGRTDVTLPTIFRIDDVTLTVRMADDPTVVTGSADQILPNSARLNMTVNPNGGDTEIWFDLDPNDDTPSTNTERVSVGGGREMLAASVTVYDLECDTTYYYEAHGENEFGSDVDLPARSFRTDDCTGGEPNADTDPAINVTASSATLTAEVDANGLPTQAWFAWGNDRDSLDLETPHVSVGSNNGNVDFSYALAGLQCEHDYFFENHAQNSAGQDDGVTLSFRTLDCGPPALPSVSIIAIDSSATEVPMRAGEFLLQRTGDTGEPLFVILGVGGTATAGLDHNLETGSIAIAPLESSRRVSLIPISDSTAEGDETVVLTIQPDSTYLVGPSATAMATIGDGEGVCVVTLIAPVGGETWVKGSPQTIRWSAGDGCVEYFLILKRGESHETFIADSVGSTEYTWTPPPWIVAGTDFRVDVWGYSSSTSDGPAFKATSEVFRLVNPAVLPFVVFQDSMDIDQPPLADYSSGGLGWGYTSSTAHSAPRSRADSPGDYGNNWNNSLVTKRIDLSGRQSVVLDLWQRFELADGDSVRILGSPSVGNWTLLRQFTGNQPDWGPVSIDLGAFAGQSVGIAFQLLSDASLVADGWYIDDVRIADKRIHVDGFESGGLCGWSGESPVGVCRPANASSASISANAQQWFGLSDVAHRGLDITGSLTIETWLKVASQAGSHQLVGKYSGGQKAYGLQYAIDGSGTELTFLASDDCLTETATTWGYPLAAGQWYHVALVYTAWAGAAELFVNGISQGYKLDPPMSLCDGTAEFAVGQREGGRFHDGLIDELRVWNVSRTAVEIAETMSVRVGCASPGLIGYWRFDGDTADCTVMENDLTPHNGPGFSGDVPFN